MPATYPILLDLRGRIAVIVGGGAVAVRKAQGLFAACGSSRSPGNDLCVRVVAPEISDSMPAEVERINEPYRPEHLTGATLVFAATDSAEVNESVVRDARSRGVLVSRADEPDDGDFALPAIHRDGPIIVTVSAGSPALAAFIRDRIEASSDASWLALARETQLLRPLIVASELAPPERADALRSLASQDAIDVLNACGSHSLREWLISRYPKLKSVLHAGSR